MGRRDRDPRRAPRGKQGGGVKGADPGELPVGGVCGAAEGGRGLLAEDGTSATACHRGGCQGNLGAASWARERTSYGPAPRRPSDRAAARSPSTAPAAAACRPRAGQQAKCGTRGGRRAGLADERPLHGPCGAAEGLGASSPRTTLRRRPAAAAAASRPGGESRGGELGAGEPRWTGSALPSDRAPSSVSSTAPSARALPPSRRSATSCPSADPLAWKRARPPRRASVSCRGFPWPGGRRGGGRRRCGR